MKKYIYIILFATVALFSTCKKETADKDLVEEEGTGVISSISENVVVIDNDNSDNITFDETTGEVTLTNQQSEIVINSVLVLDLDTAGLLRKVTSVSNTGGNYICATEQATLEDVFVDVEFLLSTSMIEPAGGLKSGMSNKEISKALTDKEGFIHPVTVIYHTKDGKVIKSALGEGDGEFGENMRVYQDFSGTEIYKNSNVNFYISEGYAEFAPVFKFEFDFDAPSISLQGIDKGELKKFKFWSDRTKFDFKTMLTLEATASFSVEEDKVLIENVIKTKFKFPTTPPIWISVNCDIHGKYTLDASAQLTATTGFQATRYVTLGVNYENAAWSTFKEFEKEDTFYPLVVVGGASLSQRLEIYPHFDVKLYSVLGPTLDIAPFIYNENNVDISGAWDSKLDLGLDVRIGAHVEVCGKELIGYQSDNLNLFTLNLWNTPANIEIVSGNEQTGVVNTELALPIVVKVTDNLGNPVSLTPVVIEVLSGGGSFADSKIFTDINGLASINWTLGSQTGQHTAQALVKKADGTNITDSPISLTANIGSEIATLTTNAASSITETTATSGGNITADGGATVTARGVCWGTSTNPTTADNFTTDGSGTGTFTSSLTGLTAGTTYYARAYATNSQGTAYGNEQSFTSTAAAGLPSLTTDAASSITQTTATSGGNITADGGAAVTARGVCWGTSTSPTTANNLTTDGNGIGTFTSSLTGLTAGTTYYVRAYATNSQGTAYGSEQSFTSTAAAGLPTLTTDAASSITQTTATSGGNITADGGAAVTARGVCWSTTTNPTTANNLTTDGSGTGTFTSSLTGLTAGTTYYVRAYATNSQGTAYGNQESFTTTGSNPTGTVTDYDGNSYNTVTIGTQEWMAENLKVTHYANGTAIPLVTDNTAWGNLGDNDTDKAYCYYNNNASSEADTYGALYTYAAAMNGAASSTTNPSGVQGVCPTGWHLPSDAEWTELTDYLINNGYGYEGSGSDIAKSMAATSGWNTYSTAGRIGNDQASNNSSGFSAFPGGYRSYSSGSFYDVGNYGLWWSASQGSSTNAWERHLDYNSSGVGRYNSNKSGGFSVRCLRD